MIDVTKLEANSYYATKNQVLLLAGLVIASGAKLVFDIGTGLLGSGNAFLYGLEKTGGRLVSCDPVKRFNFSHPSFIFIQKRSEEVAKTWKDSIDILFIDGEHSAPSVKRDFDLFYPFVKQGGYVALHDTLHPILSERGADVLIKQLEAKGVAVIEFYSFPGLALVQKRGV